MQFYKKTSLQFFIFLFIFIFSSFFYKVSAENIAKQTSVDFNSPIAWQVEHFLEKSTQWQWEPIPEATEYVVKRHDGVIVYEGSNTTFTDTGLKDSSPYGYTFYSKFSDGSISSGNTFYARTRDSMPEAPINLTATTLKNSLLLKWNTVNFDTNGSYYYEVFQDNVKVSTFYANTTEKELTGLNFGGTHTYKIRLVQKEQYLISPFSNSVTGTAIITLPPNNVTNFKGESTAKTITLTWDKNDTAEIYEVKRWGEVIYSGPNTSFTDHVERDMTLYNYSIAAIDDRDLKSNTVQTYVTTKAATPKLMIKNIGYDNVQLAWEETGIDYSWLNTYYEIRRNGERIFSAAGMEDLYTREIEKEVLDTGLEYGKTYTYDIVAIKNGIVSEKETKTITTKSQRTTTVQNNTYFYSSPSLTSPKIKVKAGEYVATGRMKEKGIFFIRILYKNNVYYVEEKNSSDIFGLPYEKNTIQVNKVSRLFTTPDFSKQYKNYIISPQTVNVLEKVGDWYKIETWVGESWIYLPPKSNVKAEEYLYLPEGADLYNEPNLKKKNKYGLSEQVVFIVSITKDHKFALIHTWAGDKWIRLD